jgi:iron complex outermembrane receptor protein
MIAPQPGSPMAGQWGSITTAANGWRVVFALCLVLCIVRTSMADPPKVYDIDLPAEGVADALNGLSAQTGAPVVFPYDLVKNRRTSPVAGRFTLLGALDALLKDTGLSGGLSDKGVLTVSLAKSAALKSGETLVTHNDNQQNTNKKRAARPAGIAAFFASIAAGFSSAPHAADDSSSDQTMANVVVTAQKRVERLQDVPVPVTVLNAEALADTNQVLLTDYVSHVPGLEISPSYGGAQSLSIRGITAGIDPNPAVGIMIDGVPYGAAAGAIELTPPPDIDPGDLARIEVLRGPQGTLYGADSLGGLINFVTTDPSTGRYSARVEAGTDGVYNGSGLGYNFRASANIPLADTFAIRVSGFDRHEPGYIDNVETGQKGVNASETKGGRISGLWTPSDTASLKLNALYQDTRYNGVSDVDTENQYTGLPLTGLQQSYLRGTGESDRIIQAYSGTFKVKLGDIDLTSLTGYNVMSFHDDHDFSNLFGGLSGSFFPGFTGAPTFDQTVDKKITEELRLSGSLWHAVDWQVGGFYTHEHDAPILVSLDAADPTTGQIGGIVLGLDIPQTYTEYAAFADLTYHITDRFDVQVGGRESKYDLSNPQTDSGALYGPTPVVAPVQKADANAFTYLLTPRFKISPDLMVYARLASGYRPGGSNCAGVCTGIEAGAPATYGPDKTYDYDLGIKADFLDHLLSIDGSLYYIDWKHIQISFTLPPPSGFLFEGNGNNAKSEGVELSVEARPTSGLTLSGWVSYDDAVLTQPFPAISTLLGAAGDRLPNSARFSGNLSLQQDVPISASLTGFARAQISYVGERLGLFTADGERQTFPAYAKLDLRAGMHYDSWTASVYVNNVADKRGLISGGIGTSIPFSYYVIQPRTVGLSVAKTF